MIFGTLNLSAYFIQNYAPAIQFMTEAFQVYENANHPLRKRPRNVTQKLHSLTHSHTLRSHFHSIRSQRLDSFMHSHLIRLQSLNSFMQSLMILTQSLSILTQSLIILTQSLIILTQSLMILTQSLSKPLLNKPLKYL